MFKHISCELSRVSDEIIDGSTGKKRDWKGKCLSEIKHDFMERMHELIDVIHMKNDLYYGWFILSMCKCANLCIDDDV